GGTRTLLGSTHVDRNAMSHRTTERTARRPRRFDRVAPLKRMRVTLRWMGAGGVTEVATLVDVSEGGCSGVRAPNARAVGSKDMFGALEMTLDGDADSERAPVVLRIRSEFGSRLGLEYVDAASEPVRRLRETTSPR